MIQILCATALKIENPNKKKDESDSDELLSDTDDFDH